MFGCVAEIEKLERSLAQRPECVAETTLLKETEEDRILKWDQLQAVVRNEPCSNDKNVA